jgi:hypothetical protein
VANDGSGDDVRNRIDSGGPFGSRTSSHRPLKYIPNDPQLHRRQHHDRSIQSCSLPMCYHSPTLNDKIIYES